MKEHLISLLKHYHILQEKPRLLLAVSGGMDSMVLLHLLHSLKLPCVIAHCNFGLRGDEAMEDERFVREQAVKAGFPILVRRFRTVQYAEKHGISIQMAARDLRYRWFREACIKEGCAYIVTAHHAGDQTETFFINLLRGTGLKGLRGMAVLQGDLFRPLLFTSREEILQYASDRNIPYCDDSSNDELHYLRNQVRHQLIPLMEQIRPGFRHVMQRNLQRFRLENNLLSEQISDVLPGLTSPLPGGFRIDIAALLQTHHPELFLFQLLEPLGFNPSQVIEVYDALDKQPGKTWKSAGFRLVKDRTCLLVNAAVTGNSSPEKPVLLYRRGNKLAFPAGSLPFTLKCSIKTPEPEFRPETDPGIALLDVNTLSFPLELRKWKPGDRFRPLGMKGMKKISDFLTDEKMSLPEKENTWVLLSGKQVAWVVGKRIDHRFRITGITREYLRISLSGT